MDKAGCAEAFAEAYGLVRWFYPGDMPEGFDWNEFALYGMREVLECEDVEELEMTLTGLFGPVAPGVEFSDSDEYGRWELITPEDTSGMYQIAWQHCGVDLGPESNWYVSKRTGRAMQTDNSSKIAVELGLVPGLPYYRMKVSADIRNHNPESLKIYFKTAFNTGLDYYTSVCRDGKSGNAVAQDSAWHGCARRFESTFASAGKDAGGVPGKCRRKVLAEYLRSGGKNAGAVPGKCRRKEPETVPERCRRGAEKMPAECRRKCRSFADGRRRKSRGRAGAGKWNMQR